MEDSIGSKDQRWKLRFEYFCNALSSLEEIFSQDNIQNDILIDAAIQRYEVTFELSWKTIQDYLLNNGIIDSRGPKNIIQKAYLEGIIDDGQVWSDMLRDRNVLSHEYVYKESRIIFQRIETIYLNALTHLRERLENE